jgi:hypothetical protein
MDQLSEIMRDMAFMGWKGEAARGFSHKEDAGGNIIARAHDATWIADVEEATARVERMAVLRELERRHKDSGGASHD